MNYIEFKDRWKCRKEMIPDRSDKYRAYLLYDEGMEYTNGVWRDKIRKIITNLDKYGTTTTAERLGLSEVTEIQRGILAALLGE